MSFDLGDSLEKFYTVAKRITKLETLIVGNRDTAKNLNTLMLQLRPPGKQVCHLVSQMRLGRLAADIVFSTDVHLHLAKLQPEATTLTKRRRLQYFAET